MGYHWATKSEGKRIALSGCYNSHANHPKASAMPAPQLILTIAPERDGTTVLLVALRDADGRQGPARRISVDLDERLGAFVATIRRSRGNSSRRSNARTGDGEPASAFHAADGEQIR